MDQEIHDINIMEFESMYNTVESTNPVSAIQVHPVGPWDWLLSTNREQGGLEGSTFHGAGIDLNCKSYLRQCLFQIHSGINFRCELQISENMIKGSQGFITILSEEVIAG
jgi:hypothetical protein